MIFYYRPQQELRKGNVFTPVCDSVHKRRVVWADTPQADTPSPSGQTPPWADTPQADPTLGQTPTWADFPQDGHCSGRYASYWNAFLLIMLTVCNFRVYLNLPVWMSKLIFNLAKCISTCPNYIFTIIHVNIHCFIQIFNLTGWTSNLKINLPWSKIYLSWMNGQLLRYWLYQQSHITKRFETKLFENMVLETHCFKHITTVTGQKWSSTLNNQIQCQQLPGK